MISYCFGKSAIGGSRAGPRACKFLFWNSLILDYVKKCVIFTTATLQSIFGPESYTRKVRKEEIQFFIFTSKIHPRHINFKTLIWPRDVSNNLKGSFWVSLKALPVNPVTFSFENHLQCIVCAMWYLCVCVCMDVCVWWALFNGLLSKMYELKQDVIEFTLSVSLSFLLSNSCQSSRSWPNRNSHFIHLTSIIEYPADTKDLKTEKTNFASLAFL